MKKVNESYVAKWYGIPSGILLILGVLGLILEVFPLFFLALLGIICVFVIIPGVLKTRMEKSALALEAEFPQKNFSYQQKFTTNNGIFYIDVGGQLGVIWKHNPTEFYLANLAGLSEVWTNDGRQLNGTSLVSCQFRLDGKKYKIYTLRVSNGQLSMKSPEVLEAISKADRLCEMLSLARQAALENHSAS